MDRILDQNKGNILSELIKNKGERERFGFSLISNRGLGL